MVDDTSLSGEPAFELPAAAVAPPTLAWQLGAKALGLDCSEVEEDTLGLDVVVSTDVTATLSFVAVLLFASFIAHNQVLENKRSSTYMYYKPGLHI